MTLEEFKATLTHAVPPQGLSPILEALWQDAKGNWEPAHNIAQRKEGTPEYDRLHAYLHRKEDDKSNASYWYRRAGTAEFTGSLEKEWEQLVSASLR